ncbi:MAG TPA: hypothetical protein VE642_01930, partial [Pyrinomonadaceae bacterium]|nr:hypothetical protein [Pyrinomonadaceae bacterium]
MRGRLSLITPPPVTHITMSIYDDIEPLGLEGVSTYPLAERPSKVATEDFARPFGEGASLKEFLSSLPNILAVRSIREIAASMRRARDSGKPVVWGIGGHVVKVGLAPLIIDLMGRGFVSCVAANGSVLVHDAEIALVGSTSEDVDATLGAGAFGAADETGRLLNGAAREAARDRLGMGEAVGRALLASGPRHPEL